MRDLPAPVEAFLREAGWGGAEARHLAGDASSRRYTRLVKEGRSAILMQVPEPDQTVTRRFATVGDWLRAQGYSAPATLAHDPGDGLLLCEDFGDGLVAVLAEGDSALEARLYLAAIGFLADLRRHPAPDFAPILDGPALARLLAVLPEWYLPFCGIAPGAETREIGPEIARLHDKFCSGSPPVLGMRDFHAGNIVWLPERKGVARIGLLDFQDAVATHPAYDVVSLLQDARRDLAPGLEHQMIGAYISATGCDQVAFRTAYAMIGVQRGLRILGVFARLALQAGRPQYLQYLPRVWSHISRNLAHPELARLRGLVEAGIPAPGSGMVQ